MNAETFCGHFATFADAPNGIAKLRELILQLAVQGKLISQDPSDEPASRLIARLRSDVNGADLPIPPDDLSLSEAETPFTLPPNWLWLRFGDFLDIQGGGQPPKSEFISSPSEGYVRLLQIRDFGPSPVPTFIRADSVSRFCTSEDVMLARYGASVGKIFMGQDGAYNVALTRIIFSHDHIYNRFVYYLLLSPLFQVHLEDASRSAQAGFNKGNLHPIPLPLPPLAEQRRIVEKVDQLLGLCDELAARQAAQREKRQRLVGATLDRLVTTRNPAESPTHAHRLRNHFDQLFDTPTTIPQLRQTILQLAVQGQLVPQDPDDEPADELLERARREREKFCYEHDIRTPKTAVVLSDDELWQLPAGWRWTRLASVFNAISDGDHGAPPQTGSGIAFLTIGNVTTGFLNFEGCRHVSKEYFDSLKFFRKPVAGDLLYTVVGATYGRPILVNSDRPFCVQRHIAILKPSTCFEVAYLRTLMASPFIYGQASSSITGTAQPTLPLGPLRDFLVPVPPLAEQKRIVTKVTELLSLCDALEAKLTQAESASTKLLSAAVHHLLHNSPS